MTPKPAPKAAKPINDAPKDGTIIDLWSPYFGWVRDVWWDEADAIWVTACPAPYTGWRLSKYERAA